MVSLGPDVCSSIVSVCVSLSTVDIETTATQTQQLMTLIQAKQIRNYGALQHIVKCPP